MNIQFTNQINSNKAQIAAFAFNQFNATFINVMNGRKEEFQRNLNGFAHLRFTQCFESNGLGFKKLSTKDYVHTYVYYTTSTCTDTVTNLNDKLERNLNDLCFNVRKEVLDNDTLLKPCSNEFGTNKFLFLIDTGSYFFTIDKASARKNIIKTQIFQGHEVCTVRLEGPGIKKTIMTKIGNAKTDFNLNWNPKYIENITYSKYRARNGYIKVTILETGDMHYFTSTGSCKDFFEKHGTKHNANWFRVNANKGAIVKGKNGLSYKFERVTEVLDNSNNSSTSCEASTDQAPQENGLPLSIRLKDISYSNRYYDEYLMVNTSPEGEAANRSYLKEECLF